MEHEKNEPRRRPPERNSRAAQAAQQRRDQRREQAHLEELRQKQRKRARHRTRRRINPGVWKRILIMAAVVAAVVLSMVLFFRVRSVEVTGSAYYPADEIRAACGVAQGDNLLTLSRARIAGNIMAELPYVSTVQVTRRLPDTLELTVTEYDVTYAAQGADGASYLITADGKITEKIDETAARGHIAVTGLQLADPVVGQQLTVAGDDDVAAQGQHDALCALLQALEEAGLTKKAASVAVPSSYELSFWYGDQYEVKLGNSENLPYKLAYLEKVLESLADYQTGTIDLSFSEGSEARFTPKQ